MNELRWEIKVPLWRNRLIRNQLGVAIGIPFGALLVVLLLVQAYNGLIMVGALFTIGFLLVTLVFRGTYDVRFVLDEAGVSCHTLGAQRKRVRRMSIAVALLGLLKGNASAVAIGIASGAGTDACIHWKRVRRVKFYDGGRTILIRAGFCEAVAVFCAEENRVAVKQFIRDKTKGK